MFTYIFLLIAVLFFYYLLSVNYYILIDTVDYYYVRVTIMSRSNFLSSAER